MVFYIKGGKISLGQWKKMDLLNKWRLIMSHTMVRKLQILRKLFEDFNLFLKTRKAMGLMSLVGISIMTDATMIMEEAIITMATKDIKRGHHHSRHS